MTKNEANDGFITNINTFGHIWYKTNLFLRKLHFSMLLKIQFKPKLSLAIYGNIIPRMNST